MRFWPLVDGLVVGVVIDAGREPTSFREVMEEVARSFEICADGGTPRERFSSALTNHVTGQDTKACEQLNLTQRPHHRSGVCTTAC